MPEANYTVSMDMYIPWLVAGWFHDKLQCLNQLLDVLHFLKETKCCSHHLTETWFNANFHAHMKFTTVQWNLSYMDIVRFKLVRMSVTSEAIHKISKKAS